MFSPMTQDNKSSQNEIERIEIRYLSLDSETDS